MDITFCVLHAFHPNSNPDGDVDARRILHDCLVRLNHAHSTNGVGPARYWLNGRLVVWNLPHVFTRNANFDDNGYALRCLLDCLTELNISFLKFGGPFTIPTLYDSGVYYRRTEIWDTIPSLYRRGFGDCKSLTCALLAQYAQQGIDCAPVFRFDPRPDGGLNYHILVQTAKADDPFEDPSKVLGMGQDEVASIRGLD